MTVAEMIRQLTRYPMDWQVTDYENSPIMFMMCTRKDEVRLKPKRKFDLKEWLDDFFEEAKKSAMSDNEVLEELIEQGITFEDLKAYNPSVASWAMSVREE